MAIFQKKQELLFVSPSLSNGNGGLPCMYLLST